VTRLVGIAAALAAVPILIVVLILGAVGGTPAATAAGTATSVTSVAGLPHMIAPSKAAATAIAYAEHQLGKPYPVRRHRAGRLRLFGPDDDGLPGRRA
jgi:hypothetical protein